MKRILSIILMLMVGIASFGQRTLTVQVTPKGTGTVNVASTSTHASGEKVTLTATPATDCTFLYWREGTTTVSTSQSFTYTMPNRDVTLTAHFKYSPDNPSAPDSPTYLGKVEMPTISVSGETLTISGTTTGATIYYTLDGKDPTTASTVYSKGVKLTHNCTVKAMATHVNMDNSAVASYTVNSFKAATPTFSQSGDKLTISCATNGATIYYTIGGAEPTNTSTKYTGPITITDNRTIKAIAYATNFNASAVATYTPTSAQCQAVTISVSGSTATLTCATSGAAIYYTLDGSTPTTSSSKYTAPITLTHNCTIKAFATKANMNNSTVASYTVNTFTAATPTFSQIGDKLTISCATSGATIYYTIGGATPTNTSTKYTGPITITDNRTVKAIAYATNFNASAVATYTPTSAQCQAVTISVSGTKATLSCATSGATIYYTLDGSTPTTSSSKYTAPFTLTHNCTIKAIATKANMNNSVVASYEVKTFTAATPTFSQTGDKLTISCATSGATIYYTIGGATPTSASTKYTGPITITDNRTIKAIAYATNFNTSAIATYTPNSATCQQVTISVSGTTATLTCSTSGATIYYTLDGTTPTTSSSKYTAPFTLTHNCTIKAFATKANMNNSAVASYEVKTFTAATPTFSQSGDKLTISCATSGATIYYTIGGTTPTNASTKYTGPITITDNRTIKAIAYAPNFNASSVASYTPNSATCQQVSISVSGTTATLTCATSGATIYYTLDGSTPTTSSSKYSAPFTLTHNCTIKAIATKANMNNSAVSSYTVNTFTTATPTFSQSGDKLTISCTTAGSTIYYTIGGATPTNASTKYTGPITITDNRTIKAIAYATNFNASSVATYTPSSAACQQVTISVSGTTATLTCATSGATIYYTLDGSTPTTSSTKYTAPFTLTHNCTIKAIATKANMNNSAVSSYEVKTFNAATPTFSQSGDKLTISCATSGATIYYTIGGTTPTNASTKYTGPITITDNRTIKAIAYADNFNPSAVASYTPTSATCQQVTISVSGITATLGCATSGATIYYTLDGTTPTTSSTKYTTAITLTHNCTIKAIATKANMNNSAVSSYEVKTFTAATPTFSQSGDKLTISCATSGATIYYTIGGATPTNASTKYTGPITITDNRTIKAIAYADNFNASAVATYTPNSASCQQVSISVSGTTATLSCSTSGATIYYTLDGTTPTTSSTKYTASFTLTHNCTIKAIATKANMNNSAVASYEVKTFSAATPTFSQSGDKLTISCTTSGATIYYTIGGATPTNASTKYTEPITITDNRTIKAIAYADNFNASAVATFTPTSATCQQVAISVSGTIATLSCTTNGASIYYTLDGTTPTTSSTKYTAPITLTHNCTIKAIAAKENMNNSAVTSYEVKTFTAATPTFSQSGDKLTISCATIGATIYNTIGGATPTKSSTKYTGPITITDNRTIKAIAYATNFNASAVATYTPNSATCQQVSISVSGTTATLNCATSGATIYYTLDGSTPTTSSTKYTAPITLTHNCTIKAVAAKENMNNSTVASYTVNTFTAATPTFSQSSDKLTISCATSGATIHFTIGGATPTNASTKYTGPITITDNRTIKAIAYADNFNVSAVATYTPNSAACQQVSISFSGTTATLTCATSGATIYYTLDGSTPTTSSTKYTAPITLTHNCTIKAIAVKENLNNSTVAIYEVNTFTTATPTFSQSGDKLTISCSTSGATIYYTLDGTTPTTSSTKYTAPIALTRTCTIKAIAVKASMNNSAVASYIFSATHEYVDLGLPSGLMWATCNVGAAKPEDYGDHYAWGETYTKNDYSYEASITYGKTIEQLKEAGIIGIDGNLTADYDVASKAWGDAWRMPAIDEITELIDNTTATWTTRNGVYGCEMTSNKNGNSIFLPAAGYRSDSLLLNEGQRGYYRSSSPNVNDSHDACYMLFYSGNRVEWKEQGGRRHGLSVRPVFEKSTCATPTFSQSGDKLTISCATAGATIYYTIGGATPTNASTKYTGPITITDNRTIKAIAYADNFNASAVATYTPNSAACQQVSISVSGTTATLTCATSGATIYYTLDGSTPTTSSTKYTAPFTLTHNCTIKAISVKENMNNSTVASYEVKTFTAATPTFSQSGDKLTISCTTANATIYYTIGGEEPTLASNLYTEPLKLIDNRVVKARAYAGDMSPSDIAVFNPTINYYTATGIISDYEDENGDVSAFSGFNVDMEVYEDHVILHNWANVAGYDLVLEYERGTEITDYTITNVYNIINGETKQAESSLLNGWYTVQTGIMQLPDLRIKPASCRITSSFSKQKGEILLYLYIVGFSSQPYYYLTWGDINCADVTIDVKNNIATLSCTTDGATIYYTLDGTIPTNASHKYTAPITLTHNCTLKAIATKEGMNDSEVSSYIFATTHEYVDLGLPSGLLWATCNVGAAKPEDYGNYYAWGETYTKNVYSYEASMTYGKTIEQLKEAGIIGSDGNLTSDYDVASKAWGSAWRIPTIDEIKELIDNTTSTWTTQNGICGRTVTSKKNGNSIFLPAAGYRSDSSLINDGLRGAYRSSSPNVSDSHDACYLSFYSDGLYEWNERGGRRHGLSVRPVFEKSTCATPTFSQTGDKLTISCTTSGATIYYTIGGATPTNSSTKYTGPITITDNRTIKAIAYADNFNASAVASYTPNSATCQQVTISVSGTTATLTCATSGATIYYTIDGSTPTTSSTKYTAPFTLTHNCTIKAIATKENMNNSTVASYTVNTFTAATPTFSQISDKLTISCATSGATIYYTIGGATPTNASTKYTGPITITDNRTIKAIAYADNFNASAVATYTPTSFTCEAVSVSYDGRYVTLATATQGASIYYTTDGSEPTSDAAVYTVPFDAGGILTVKAVAMKENWNNSESTSETLPCYCDGRTAWIDEAGALAKAFERGTDSLTAVVWNVDAAMPNDALAGINNPNLLLYVKMSSYAPSSVRNVVASGKAEEIVLTDGYDFLCPEEFTAHSISYTHRYTMPTPLDGRAAGWETIALPFDVQSITHETNGMIAPFAANDPEAKPFWLCTMTAEGFKRAAAIEANTPYIICMPNNVEYADEYILAGDVTFSAQNVTVPVTEQKIARYGELQFVPTTTSVAQNSNVFTINRSGDIPGSMFVSDNTAANPFEAYITTGTSPNAVKAFNISNLLDDLVDEIPMVAATRNEDSKVYSISGALVSTNKQTEGLPKGIYIIGKKRVIVK